MNQRIKEVTKPNPYMMFFAVLKQQSYSPNRMRFELSGKSFYIDGHNFNPNNPKCQVFDLKQYLPQVAIIKNSSNGQQIFISVSKLV
jgi:hypothetical protein